jgi:hypothetical protein
LYGLTNICSTSTEATNPMIVILTLVFLSGTGTGFGPVRIRVPSLGRVSLFGPLEAAFIAGAIEMINARDRIQRKQAALPHITPSRFDLNWPWFTYLHY